MPRLGNDPVDALLDALDSYVDELIRAANAPAELKEHHARLVAQERGSFAIVWRHALGMARPSSASQRMPAVKIDKPTGEDE